MMASTDKVRSKKAKPGNQCKPSGPYCVGMHAILDADVRRGAQPGIAMSTKSLKTRTVIPHEARVEGKKTRMVFTFCPCCAGRLIAEEPKKGKG